jgi:hypothetical protein
LGGINNIMYGIAAGMAALIIVIQAIKWKTSDSKLERDQAKRAIINVVLGLIIVLIAAGLVGVFYGTAAVAPHASADCRGLDGWYSTSFGPRCIGVQLCTDYVEKSYRTYYAKSPGCSFTETQKKTECNAAPQDCPQGQFCQNGACISAKTTTTTTTTVTTVPGPAKTVKCQTSLECYEKLGICWVCPDGGGECRTIHRDVDACPDCGIFPKGFACYHAVTGNDPYCCFKKGDKLDGPACNDGTPLNSCSTKYPGLYCKSLPDELKPEPACGGVTCTDSDGGKDPANKGVCSDVVKYYGFYIQDNDYTDMCVQGKLVETFCEGNQCKQEETTCPAGTACIKPGACA